MLLHGTTSSRQIWAPLIPALASEFEVIALDLPGHGESSASSYTPPDWARDVASWMDSLDLDQALVAGHSAGGWTALELAKLGRARKVLALMPAGLWSRRSPLLTDLALNANWRLGRLAGARMVSGALRVGPLRAASLRSISAKPGQVAPEAAIANALSAIATESFPRHFAETRRLRFLDGVEINVPVRVVWGDKDRIAPASKSRHLDQLPPQTVVETWPDCGHMPMWDVPDRLLRSIQELSN